MGTHIEEKLKQERRNNMSNTKVTLRDVLDLNNLIYAELKELGVRVDANTRRIGTLEQFKAEMVGRMTIIGAIIVFCFNLIWDWIREKIHL